MSMPEFSGCAKKIIAELAQLPEESLQGYDNFSKTDQENLTTLINALDITILQLINPFYWPTLFKIKKLSTKLRLIHPFRFIETVFFKNLRDKTISILTPRVPLIKEEFLQGLIGSLEFRKRKNQLIAHLPSFFEKTGIPIDQLTKIINTENGWNELILLLSTQKV